jgi:hypothetical protein
MGPVLRVFDDFLPVPPESILRSSRPLIEINAYCCSIVLEALDTYKDVIENYTQNKKIVINIMQDIGTRSGLGICIDVRRVKWMDS